MNRSISSRSLVALVALALGAAPAFAQAPAAEAPKAVAETAKAVSSDGPRFTLDKDKIEVGVVPKGEEITQTFVVKNTGRTDLHITDVKPSCGCTVPEFDKVIKPGATGKITMHIDTKAFQGPISKTALILTDDPTKPQATVFVTANVKPYVETHPFGFFRLQAMTGEVASSELIIGSDEADFAPSKVELPAPYLAYTLSPVGEKDLVAGKGAKQFKIVLSTKADAPEGLLTGAVKIATGAKKQPELAVNLSGYVKPTLTISPLAVNFGNFDPKGDAVKRKIMLINNNVKNATFSVTRAESSIPGISAEVKPADNDKTRVEVVLSVDEKMKKGVFDGQVVIKTNDTARAEVKIPIKGVVL